MAKYTEKFRYRAVQKALNQGIRATVRELRVSRNTLKNWIKDYKTSRTAPVVKYDRHHNRTPPRIEKLIVHLKEKEPRITLKKIQKVLRRKHGKILSVSTINKILERFAMTGISFLPLKGQDTAGIKKGMKIVHLLLKQGNLKEAAGVLNSLPALSDFSILEKIPSRLLSPRRQAEQLEALWGILSMDEMYKKAKKLRICCEKEKLFFTAIFVATIEMNALNFLGYPVKVFSLYKKYSKYLPNLPTPLKYEFLVECFISFMHMPERYLQGIFKKFPDNLGRFVSKLPQGNHRIQWYDAMSACYDIMGEINKSLQWIENLFQEVNQRYKRRHLPEYLKLLVSKGAYSKVLEFNESFEDIPIYLSLLYSLARANALLGTGKSEEALGIALNAFYKAEKEHLKPTMTGFAFFISCCYAAQKETKKAKQYLKMSIYFAENKGLKKLYSTLLGLTPSVSSFQDAWIQLVNLYLSACKTLHKRDYLRAFRFAEKKGLTGFYRRIILLHPEAVINLIRKGKETHLPQEFLDLPVFKEASPIYKFFLLRDRRSLFYGDSEIDISPRTKDFHLLVYLILNRKKILDKESLLNIFYKKTSNPSQCLIKALSRIRNRLGLPKGVLTMRKTGVFFNTEAKVDLEEFEERYKIGRISEKVEEIQHALNEYRSCFVLYKKSPFVKMGYYYHFAEERRMIVRSMFVNLCNALIKDAKGKVQIKTVEKIKKKLGREGLLFDYRDI